MLLRAVQGDWNTVMPTSKAHDLTKDIPASLTFSQAQVTFILGHSLRSIYEDVILNAPMPEHLASLMHQLETKYPS